MIDPHVHLRDWTERTKETLRHGFHVAWRCGLSAVFEMPNTNPQLVSRAAIERRVRAADAALNDLGLPLMHGLYGGITADEGQLREVVACHAEPALRVVGLKFYGGHSTGRMGVTGREDQQRVWAALARLGYTGVVAVHAEQEEALRPERWNPQRPDSHGEARPPEAETASVRAHLDLAESAGFRGHLHLCHVSVPESVDMVRSSETGLPFGVSLGVTPHHLLLSMNHARLSATPELNVNPPLREEAMRAQLWRAFIGGRIDWIESDHAPHTRSEKLSGASGLPGLPGYRLLVDQLLRLNAEAASGESGSGALARGRPPVPSAKAVSALTVGAASRVFGIDPSRLADNPHSPFAGSRFDYASAAAEYSVDPYRHWRSHD